MIGPIGRLAVYFMAIAVVVFTLPRTTAAQTLADPYPHPDRLRPPEKSSTAEKHLKACPEYGAGFYRIDGSGTCFKVGGFVEGGVTSRH